MSRIPVFGWKAWRLSEHSFETLNELRQQITGNPQNLNPAHLAGESIHIYSAAARRKLDALSWAVTYKLQAQRKQLSE